MDENKRKINKAIKLINDYINICHCEQLEDRYIGDNHSGYYKIFEKWLNRIKNILEGE